MGYNATANEWLVFEKHAVPLFRAGMDVIEMAPGNMRRSLVRKRLVALGVAYNFADLGNRFADRLGFTKMITPFDIDADDGDFDAAVIFQALHNISKPWRWLPEVARVVRPCGFVVVVDSITEQVNRHPVDTGRLFRDGLKDLFDEAGLVLEEYVLSSLDDRESSRNNQIGMAVPVNYFAIGRKPK